MACGCNSVGGVSAFPIGSTPNPLFLAKCRSRASSFPPRKLHRATLPSTTLHRLRFLAPWEIPNQTTPWLAGSPLGKDNPPLSGQFDVSRLALSCEGKSPKTLATYLADLNQFARHLESRADVRLSCPTLRRTR